MRQRGVSDAEHGSVSGSVYAGEAGSLLGGSELCNLYANSEWRGGQSNAERTVRRRLV